METSMKVSGGMHGEGRYTACSLAKDCLNIFIWRRPVSAFSMKKKT